MSSRSCSFVHVICMNLNSWHGFCRGFCGICALTLRLWPSCWQRVRVPEGALLLGVAGDVVCGGVLEILE